jgi:hypothetical protein
MTTKEAIAVLNGSDSTIEQLTEANETFTKAGLKSLAASTFVKLFELKRTVAKHNDKVDDHLKTQFR